MKSVLISIQPKWVDKIAIGKKTIEVRKTRPKLQMPFKCYIYETKQTVKYFSLKFDGVGKVIGEFVCDRIDEYANGEIALSHNTHETCLTNCEIADYIERSKAYFWHISDLKIYDKPKELSEFKDFCKYYYDGKRCDDCKYFIDGRGYDYDESDCGCNGLKPIERPPQSWCYVEELKEKT